MNVTPVINGKIVLKKSKLIERKYRMMGVLLPHHLISYLVLYSLLTKTTRSVIVRSAILHWYNNQVAGTSTKRLAMDLSKVYQMEWNEQIAPANFTLYIQHIQDDLLNRGVEQSYIDLILANLKP